MATAESPQTDAPKKKKSLFKRTVPRKKPTEPISESPELVGTEKSQDEPNDLDFFKQSKDVFPMALQEVLVEKPPSPEKHDRKRRKVSVERESATPPRKRTPAMPGSSGGRRKSSSVRLESDADSDVIMDVKGKCKEITRSKKLPTARMLFYEPSKGSIGQIGDDDGDDDHEVAVSPVQHSQTDMTPGRRTRQSARLSNRDSSPVEVVDQDINLKEIDPDLSDLEEIPPPEQDDQLDDEFSVWVRKAQEREAILNPDAVISVLITSRIQGTVGLVVKRRLKQNVKAALNAWVDRQRAEHFHIPEEQASKLFLTWKENKIYGESTPASLGVKVTEDGELLEARGEGYKRGGLHLEAWTEEDFAEYEEYKQREQARLVGDDTDELEAELEAQNQPPPTKKKGIKVILKTREFDAFNTTVHDDTTVEMLISVFRSHRGVGLERDIEIWLDGERLENESLVKDADIDPDEPNQLEVHIK